MNPACILLVEDTELDRYVARRVFARCWPEATVLEARDGIEAIELLEAGDGPQPDLILLDVNMPRMGGHEFLNTYYADSDHECPVVMMLTSSNREEDRQLTEAFACVQHYFSKPIDRAAVQGLADWLGRTARAS